MKIKIVNKSGNPLPQYATENSAGLDLRAFLDRDVCIPVNCRALIPTGLSIELPQGYEAQIRPRSGLALKHGISIVNSPGTIDADYRGEIGVILINHGATQFIVKNGERICQMVISEYKQVELVDSEELSTTERGKGGFGHTGK